MFFRNTMKTVIPRFNRATFIDKTFTLIAIILLSILFFNCSNEYDSHLQTKWQLNTSERNNQIIFVDTIFYNFDNHVFTMQRLINEHFGENAYGQFHQKGDSLIISFPDPKYGGKERLRTNFDWIDSIRRFRIVTLTHNELCLQDQYSKLRFRKY